MLDPVDAARRTPVSDLPAMATDAEVTAAGHDAASALTLMRNFA